MSEFDLECFVANPSLSVLNLCQKDKMLQITSQFNLTFTKSILTRDLKTLILEKMAMLGHTLLPAQAETVLGGTATGSSGRLKSRDSSPGASAESEEEGGQKTPFTLRRFDPFSASSDDSRRGARLKVRLARLQLEAQEKAQGREAQLKLEIPKLEIEADKAVRLRQLEFESQREQQAPIGTTTSGRPHLANSSTPYLADVCKQLALVPPFRETEVDSYFGAF